MVERNKVDYDREQEVLRIVGVPDVMVRLDELHTRSGLGKMVVRMRAIRDIEDSVIVELIQFGAFCGQSEFAKAKHDLEKEIGGKLSKLGNSETLLEQNIITKNGILYNL